MSKIIQTADLFLKGIAQILWHKNCLICNAPISQSDRYFCSSCWQDLNSCIMDYHCPRCGRQISPYGKIASGCPLCEQEKCEFDEISAACIYKPPLSSLIVKFKLADRTNLLKPLAEIAASAIQRANFWDKIDFLVPVPLHWRKRFSRGFNQAALLAKAAKNPQIKISDDLVRLRYTKEQSALTIAGRRKNISGAFAVRKGHNFSGKNICLVDDIKTTGATLNECSKTLKQAGANKVFAFVLAVAGQSKD